MGQRVVGARADERFEQGSLALPRQIARPETGGTEQGVGPMHPREKVSNMRVDVHRGVGERDAKIDLRGLAL